MIRLSPRAIPAIALLLAAAAATAQPVLITAPTTINPGDTQIAGVPLTTAQITIRGTTLTINGRHTIASMVLERNGATGATLTHDPNTSFTYGPGDTVNGMHLIITGDLTLNSTVSGAINRIDASGRGFPAATGPGAGTSSNTNTTGAAGGAHGGNGSANLQFPGGIGYGSITLPDTFGSGGGNFVVGTNPGGAGGGSIRLDIAGTLTHNGQINANGAVNHPTGGGGAGGSIVINTNIITGNGSISANGANGGSGIWGGGGGGRIAIYYTSGTLNGNVTMNGGTGSNATPTRAGAGTFYLKQTGAGALLRIESIGSSTAAPTLITEVIDHDFVHIRNSANAVFTNPLDVGVDLEITGQSSRCEVLDQVTIGNDLLISGTNSSLTHTTLVPTTVQIGGDLTVSTGSFINVDGKGFGAASGPGAGPSSNDASYGSAGAGHGGTGTGINILPGGATYGSIPEPITLGSGGGNYVSVNTPGGSGGGAIRLIVAGLSTINGTISANGSSNSNTTGSGSGGSIWITTNDFAGAGTIRANGANGSSNVWGGGGGGRIALYTSNSNFPGSILATGGASSSGNFDYAGAGTIYQKRVSETIPTLNISGQTNVRGAITPIPVNLSFGNVAIANGSNVVFTVPQTFLGNVDLSTAARVELSGTNSIAGNLSITSNATNLTHALASPLNLSVNGDVNVGSGASINLNGIGFASGTGPGAGANSTNSGVGGPGASHAGEGGSSGVFAAGPTYGSIDQPTEMGSGGGGFPGTLGGRGGGALRLIVDGELTVNGSIAANGATGGTSAGSGSGGSLWITTGQLAGAGTISANGANGFSGIWGPSGGGRVAVYYDASTFTGTLAANAGTGSGSIPTVSGAGTILTKLTSAPVPALTVNGNASSLNGRTPINVNLSFDPVLVTGGARAVFNVPQTFAGSVVINPNSRIDLAGENSIATDLTLNTPNAVLAHLPVSPLSLTVGNNCTINTSTSITANNLGFPAATGPGAGQSSNSGSSGGAGAGHAGLGTTANNFLGGGVYGSVHEPVEMGSGGGNYQSTPGSSGGGAIKLIVGNTLTVNGSLTSNSSSPAAAAGAGSGGSLWVISSVITGNGTISANGANGGQGVWGAGSGGRIALYFDELPFSGTLTAFGGNGSSTSPVRAGAGTIFTKQSTDAFPELIVASTGTALAARTIIDENYSFGQTTITQSGNAHFTVPQTFTGDVLVSNASRLEMSGTHSIDGSLSLSSAGVLTHTLESPLDLTVSNNATIDGNSSIVANAIGFGPASGPGAGQSASNGSGAAGGGYGGRGGNASIFLGGSVYGDATQPLDLGSGGGNYFSTPGGRGGGAIKLAIGQTLTVNGAIRANGQSGNSASGAGSGGSLFLTAGQLAGSGAITANGGNGGNGTWGPGGGGRIAIYSCDISLPIGNITTLRGSGTSGQAQDGTIYFGSSSITITQQPVGGNVNSGGFSQLSVFATGSELTYQWRRRNNDGVFVNLSEGENNNYFNVNDSTLFIQGVDCSGGGDFDCLICDTCGCFPSAVATLFVDPTGDYNGDGGIDGSDIEAFFVDWQNGEAASDVNGDGGIDGSDVEFFFERWSQGC